MIRVRKIETNNWNDYIYNTLDAIGIYGNGSKLEPSETMPDNGLNIVFTCPAINRLSITPQDHITQRILLEAIDDYSRETFELIQQESNRELWGMKIVQYEHNQHTLFRPLFHFHLLVFAANGKRLPVDSVHMALGSLRPNINTDMERRIAKMERQHLMRNANDSALPVSKRSRI